MPSFLENFITQACSAELAPVTFTATVFVTDFLFEYVTILVAAEIEDMVPIPPKVHFSYDYQIIELDPTICRRNNFKSISFQELQLLGILITRNGGGWNFTIPQLPPLEARAKFLKRMA